MSKFTHFFRNNAEKKYLFQSHYDHVDWHSFLYWWSNGCKTGLFYDIGAKQNDFIISEYPDGKLSVIHRDAPDHIISGIWFYVDGNRIRLIGRV